MAMLIAIVSMFGLAGGITNARMYARWMDRWLPWLFINAISLAPAMLAIGIGLSPRTVEANQGIGDVRMPLYVGIAYVIAYIIGFLAGRYRKGGGI